MYAVCWIFISKNHRGAKSAAEKREGMSWRIEVAKLAKPEWWHGNVVHFRPLDVHQNGLCKKSHTSCSLLLWPFTSRSIRKTYCHPHLLIDPFISIYIIYHFYKKSTGALYEKYRRKKTCNPKVADGLSSPGKRWWFLAWCFHLSMVHFHVFPWAL